MLSSAEVSRTWLVFDFENSLRFSSAEPRGDKVWIGSMCTFYELSPVDLAGGDLEGYDMVLRNC